MVDETAVAEPQQEVEAEAQTPESQPSDEAPSEESEGALTEPDANPEPEAVTEAVEEAEAESPPSPDFSSLLGSREAIEKAAEASSELKQFLADTQNQATQKERARIRREAGSRENTARQTETLLRLLEEDPDQARKNTGVIYDYAHLHATDTALRNIAKESLDYFAVPADQRGLIEKAIDAVVNLDDLSSYTAEMLGLAREHGVKNAIGTLSIKDVPADSSLHNEINREVAKRVQAELKAKDIEVAGHTRGAQAPASPGTGGASRGAQPTPAEYGAATAAQRQQWNKDKIEVLLPE